MNPKERLCEAACELGFSACAVAAVQRPPHAEFFEHWLATGMAGEMRYLEQRAAERLAPHLLLPGARSVICLAVPYRPVAPPQWNWREELRGRIAAYALGSDYHDWIRARLELLVRQMEEWAPGIRCRVFVDSGPLLERDFAWLAGLGWFGKNTNILSKRGGSWFFLAEILTTWELEPDRPVAAHCGSCSRCLTVCPTGALAEGYSLDARKCISYWTIEHRGWIPLPMRRAMGNWVFGCDDCQDVCPWNEKWLRTHPDGQVQREEAFPFLPQLLALSDEEFHLRFRRSAVWRARREGLARNAAVVLGNSGNPAAIPFLARALATDPSPVVRGHAAWALGELQHPEAYDALLLAQRSEEHPAVRAEIASALRGDAESSALVEK